MRELCVFALALGCAANASPTIEETAVPDGAGGAISGSSNAGGTVASGGSRSVDAGADGRSSGAGGSLGAGGAAGTGGSDALAPVHNVLPCDALGGVGEWQQITPPGVVLENSGSNYGTQMFVVDPVNFGTVVLGTAGQGIYKTTDCGANWVMVSTGANDPEVCPGWGWTGLTCTKMVQSGRQWTFLIDPSRPEILYTNNGYGAGSTGFFKSTDGGIDWFEITPKADGVPGFGGNMQMSPSNPAHVFVTWHAPCAGDKGCISETKDGGATWKTHFGPGDWPNEVRIYPLTDTAWLVPNDGMWLTTDSGSSWNKVSELQGGGHTAGELYRAKNGAYYLGTNDGILRSPDGLAWSKVPGTGPGVHRITGDGTTMWAGKQFTCFEIGENLTDLYITSPENDGTKWTTFPSVGMNQGGTIHVDTAHHLLYSSNCRQGFWRVRTQ